METRAGIASRLKIGLLIFIITLLLPILITGIFVGLKPTDVLLAAICALVVWFTRPKRQEST